MKKTIPFTLAAVAAVLLAVPSANAILIDNRAAWETAVGPGNFSSVDLEAQTVIEVGATYNSVALSSQNLSFSSSLEARQVGIDWGTWSGGNTPRVLYTGAGVYSVSGTFGGGGLSAFGLEMEPDPFAVISMTLDLGGGNFLTQNVNGDSGAAFFGWAGENVVGFTLSSAAEFAIGRMVEGPGASTPTVPDGGSVGLMGGLVWAGLLGLGSLRRKTT